jgi:hypothetical protein
MRVEVSRLVAIGEVFNVSSLVRKVVKAANIPEKNSGVAMIINAIERMPANTYTFVTFPSKELARRLGIDPTMVDDQIALHREIQIRSARLARRGHAVAGWKRLV